MTLASRPSRGRTAILAGLRFASVSGARASSADAWEDFRKTLRMHARAPRLAAAGPG